MASLGTWPSTVGVKSARFMLQTNQRVNAAPGGGSEEAVDMLNDRLMCYLTLPINSFLKAAEVESFLASFRGQVNTVDLWHFARPTPNGTISGAPTLAADALQGASSIQVQTVPSAPGATVLGGDMLGVDGLLLMAAPGTYTADGTGKITVSIVNRLRRALTSGMDVTIDKPTGTFRLLSHSGVEFAQGMAGEVQLTLGEKP